MTPFADFLLALFAAAKKCMEAWRRNMFRLFRRQRSTCSNQASSFGHALSMLKQEMSKTSQQINEEYNILAGASSRYVARRCNPSCCMKATDTMTLTLKNF